MKKTYTIKDGEVLIGSALLKEFDKIKDGRVRHMMMNMHYNKAYLQASTSIMNNKSEDTLNKFTQRFKEYRKNWNQQPKECIRDGIVRNELKDKGIDNIICLSVNDQFVIKAWQGFNKICDKDFLFIADGNCDVTKSLGMVLDCSGFGMGNRSNRYAMIIEDKVVKKLIIEENPGVCDLTNATEILKFI